jgi:hypothetical protein
MTEEQGYQPAAVAFEAQGRLEPVLDAEAATELFNGLIRSVTQACVEAGSWMIGHVKATLEGDGDLLSISATTDDGKIRNRERLSGPLKDYRLTANVIVYGIGEDVVEKIFLDQMDEKLPGTDVQVVREEGCEDPSCQDPHCRDPSHRRIIPLS